MNYVNIKSIILQLCAFPVFVTFPVNIISKHMNDYVSDKIQSYFEPDLFSCVLIPSTPYYYTGVT